ncbi:hypothetical protein BH10PSE18_BH10PSE18_15310 [soil metagenome]
MAEDLEAELRRVLVTAPQDVWIIPVISYSHPDMSKVWHLWNQPYEDHITLEGGSIVLAEIANLQPELAGTPANLDQSYKVALDITDINDKFHEELDRIPLNTTVPMQMVYREYLSNDLTIVQASVPLEVITCTTSPGTAGIVANAPRFNVSRTGETYTTRDIPMMRGFY